MDYLNEPLEIKASTNAEEFTVTVSVEDWMKIDAKIHRYKVIAGRWLNAFAKALEIIKLVKFPGFIGCTCPDDYRFHLTMTAKDFREIDNFLVSNTDVKAPIWGNEVPDLGDNLYPAPTCPTCGEVTYSQPNCPFCGQKLVHQV